MGDFALILGNSAIELVLRKHIDLPESIFIAASKAGVGELRADEWTAKQPTEATLPCGPWTLLTPSRMEQGCCAQRLKSRTLEPSCWLLRKHLGSQGLSWPRPTRVRGLEALGGVRGQAHAAGALP